MINSMKALIGKIKKGKVVEGVEIEKVDNGYIVSIPNFIDGNGNEYAANFVYEEDEQDKFGDLKAFSEALWELVDFFGQYGSKHDAKRLRIKIEDKEER